MSYSLYFHLKPAVLHEDMFYYFVGRAHYAANGDAFVYENPDTEAFFQVRFRSGRNFRLKKTVVSVEFEINYFRPSYFAIEAEKELSAFVAKFQPQIEDPQMHGMDEGPYSGEKFISAWNFGNVFTTHNAIKREPEKKIASMPSELLRASWSWNYQLPARRRDFDCRCNVPKIHLVWMKDRICRGIIWPCAAPIVLPHVDYVALADTTLAMPRFALASWSEVIDVIQGAGFDTKRDPIQLEYSVIPTAIKDWFADKNPTDPDLPPSLDAYRIVDEEVIAAARASGEENGALSLQRPAVQGLGW
ncbi:MAG TPA: hypothetical protein VL492_12325 [Methylovirgula sp.]|jgi:hypothetical protein|nr:hypothetical protein [Methylovirgula sp.]